MRFVGGPAGATDIAYLHNDHLGTPQAMTDAAGQLLWWRDQTPFGQTVAEGGFSASPLRFSGQYADAESGLHYNYFRDYDPALGRYIQSDPIGLRGGLNTYGYVHGNPQRYFDSKGLLIETLWDAGNLIYDIWQGNWGDAVADGLSMCIPFVPAGVTKLRKLGPIDEAVGPHTVWKTDKAGNIVRHETYAPNPRNPNGWDKVQSTDVTGKPHYNKATGEYVPTPHTQGPNIPGGVRPAHPSEIPKVH